MTAQPGDPITDWHPGDPWGEVSPGLFLAPAGTAAPQPFDNGGLLPAAPPATFGDLFGNDVREVLILEGSLVTGPVLTPATQTKVALALDRATAEIELALSYLDTQGVETTAARVRELLVAMTNVRAADDQLRPPRTTP